VSLYLYSEFRNSIFVRPAVSVAGRRPVNGHRNGEPTAESFGAGGQPIPYGVHIGCMAAIMVTSRHGDVTSGMHSF